MGTQGKLTADYNTKRSLQDQKMLTLAGQTDISRYRQMASKLTSVDRVRERQTRL